MARRYEPAPQHPWSRYHTAVEESFHSLDSELRTRILTEHYVVPEREMRASGQERVDPTGADVAVIGSDVVARTHVGEVVGRAVYFGTARDVDGVYRRTVVVLVPPTGSVYSAFPRDVRPAVHDDMLRMAEETRMAARLRRAARLAEVESEVRRDGTTVPGAHLVPRMLDAARLRGFVVDDTSGFHKVTGRFRPRRVYVARRGGRVDLSGFYVKHHAVVPISEEYAKVHHIGNVRGQLDLGFPDDEVMSAYDVVLDAMEVSDG